MNDKDFEQQFKQNIQATPVSPPQTNVVTSSKLPLVISIILAVIVLLESIILAITLVNYFSFFTIVESEEVVYEEDYNDTGTDDIEQSEE